MPRCGTRTRWTESELVSELPAPAPLPSSPPPPLLLPPAVWFTLTLQTLSAKTTMVVSRLKGCLYALVMVQCTRLPVAAKFYTDANGLSVFVLHPPAFYASASLSKLLNSGKEASHVHTSCFSLHSFTASQRLEDAIALPFTSAFHQDELLLAERSPRPPMCLFVSMCVIIGTEIELHAACF